MVLMMTDTRVMSIDELNAFLASSDVLTFKGNSREEIVGEGLCIASRSSVPVSCGVYPPRLRSSYGRSFELPSPYPSHQGRGKLRIDHLKGARQLGGAKFRRQTPIGPYIGDFASLEHRLVVEIDGGQHNTPQVR
jgi:hypothetical protein